MWQYRACPEHFKFYKFLFYANSETGWKNYSCSLSESSSRLSRQWFKWCCRASGQSCLSVGVMAPDFINRQLISYPLGFQQNKASLAFPNQKLGDQTSYMTGWKKTICFHFYFYQLCMTCSGSWWRRAEMDRLKWKSLYLGKNTSYRVTLLSPVRKWNTPPHPTFELGPASNLFLTFVVTQKHGDFGNALLLMPSRGSSSQ